MSGGGVSGASVAGRAMVETEAAIVASRDGSPPVVTRETLVVIRVMAETYMAMAGRIGEIADARAEVRDA